MALDTTMLVAGSNRTWLFIVAVLYVINTVFQITFDSMDLAKAVQLFCYKENATCKYGWDVNSIRLTKWAATVLLHEIVMITSCMPVVAEIQKYPKMLRCWSFFIPFSVVVQFFRGIQVEAANSATSGPIFYYSHCENFACSSMLTAIFATVIAVGLLFLTKFRYDEMVMEKTLRKRDPSPDVVNTRSRRNNTATRSTAPAATAPNFVPSCHSPTVTGFRNPVYMQDPPSLLFAATRAATAKEPCCSVDLRKNSSWFNGT